MRHPVIAICLDSAEAALIERWTAEGKLPTLASLMAGGSYGRTQGNAIDFSDVAWSTFYTGCWQEKTGFWHHVDFDPETYRCRLKNCDYQRTPPFYALGEAHRVAAFDLPKTKMCDGVNGLQVLGWGAHSPYTPTVSKPADVLERIKAQYGLHPALRRDFARTWRRSSIARLLSRCLKGIALRAAVCSDLLAQDQWDLFLTAFSEIHSIGHCAWHISQDSHPIYNDFADILGDRDPVLEVYQATDRALGELFERAPAEARVIVVSPEGMTDNNVDLPNMAFLPEILYRMSFPGHAGLAAGAGGANTPAPDRVLRPANLGWVRSVYKTKVDHNPLRRLIRQTFLMEVGHRIETLLFGEAEGPQYPYKFRPYWHPGMWYSPYWNRMRAFVLPGQADGLIRINLQGRESNGIVPLEEYDAECREVTAQLMQLRDPRSNRQVVTEVIHTRRDSEILESRGLMADLVVKWDPEVIIDVLDHPTLGRFGPLAFRRTAAHTNHGFFIAHGPGIPAGLHVKGATWVDMAPMILDLMGAAVPDYMDGRSPLCTARSAA
ncbi:MAG: alkaline phosphatase family protein [Kiloniellales bacterium]